MVLLPETWEGPDYNPQLLLFEKLIIFFNAWITVIFFKHFNSIMYTHSLIIFLKVAKGRKAMKVLGHSISSYFIDKTVYFFGVTNLKK